MRVDVAVIGAGIAGSTLAYMLARRGYRVLLGDCIGVGGRLSIHSTGVAAPLANENTARIEKLLEHVRDCRLPVARRIRVLHVGAGRGKQLDRGEVRELIGYDVGEAVEAKGYWIDAHAYTHCLISKAVSENLAIAEGHQLRPILGRGVYVGNERVEADAVIVAAGAWSKPLLRLLNVEVKLVKLISVGVEAPGTPRALAVIVHREPRTVVVFHGGFARVAYIEGSIDKPLYNAYTSPRKRVENPFTPKGVVTAYVEAATTLSHTLGSWSNIVVYTLSALKGFEDLATTVDNAISLVEKVLAGER